MCMYASTTFDPSSLSRFSATGKSNDLDPESEKSEALRQRSTKKRELSTTLNPSLVGSYSSATYIDQAISVAIDPSKGYAYVTGYGSDSLAIIDVGTDPYNPSLVGSYSNDTYIDGARGVAIDTSKGYA